MDKKEQCSQNTDKEIWRKGDYYSPNILVTKDGGITICVGGSCITKPVEEWHKLALSSKFSKNEEVKTLSVEEIFTIMDKSWLESKGQNRDERFKDVASALYPHLPRFTGAQIDAALPKKKESHWIQTGQGSYDENADYNKGIDDCRQALLKLREVEQNGE